MSTSKKTKNIDPPPAEAVDSKVTSASFDSNRQGKFGRKLKRMLKHPAFLSSIGLVVVIGILYFFLTGGFNRNTIVIGDTKITKKAVSNYARLLEAYEKAHPGSSFGGDLNQYASDKLVLNAALKLEAKKYNVTLTDHDIATATGQTFSNAQTETAYVKSYRDSPNPLGIINLENIAYQNKLQDKLLGTENLTMVTMILDTPYFDGLSGQQAQAAYDAAQSRLKNDFLPLVASGKPEQTIAQKADIAYQDSPADSAAYNKYIANQSVLYFSQGVVAVSKEDGYQKGLTGFNDNDSKAWIHGNLGTIYSTTDKINQLKKVGDNTGVFASKSGALMIIRLDSRSGGSYNSWTDFLNTYKKKYTSGRLKFSATSITSSVVGLANSLVSVISTPGLSEAWADSSCNSSHVYTLSVVAWNNDPLGQVAIPGVDLHQTRSPGDSIIDDNGVKVTHGINGCGASSLTITSQNRMSPNCSGAWPNPGYSSCSGNAVQDNCYDAPPNFSEGADPGGYHKEMHAAVLSNGGGSNAKWQHNPLDPLTFSLGAVPFWGYPDPPNDDGIPHIVPGKANFSAYTVLLLYQPNALSWQLGTGASESPPTVVPGQSARFNHNIDNLGPDTASYSWHIQESYGVPSDPNGSCSGAWTETGIAGPTKSVVRGEYYPNTTNTKVPWPINTSAPNNSMYCQRIVFNHVNGPNDPTTTVGVVVYTRLHVNPSTPVITCSSTYIPHPPPPDNVMPTGSGWSSSTSGNPVGGYADVNISGTDASPSNFQQGNTYDDLTGDAPSGLHIHSAYTATYTATSPTVTVTVDYYEYALRHDRDSSGNKVYQLYKIPGASTSTSIECYHAKCTVSSVTGDLPAGVKAGSSFTVHATVTNTEPSGAPQDYPPLAASLGGNGLSLTSEGPTHHYLNFGGETNADPPGFSELAPGQSTAVNFTTTATVPADGKPYLYTLNPYVDYFNGFAVPGGGCGPVSIYVYSQFSLTPTIQTTLLNDSNQVDTENPTHVTNTACVTEVGPVPSISEHLTGSLYEIPAGGGAHVPQGSPSSTSSDGPFNTGTQVCLYDSTNGNYNITIPLMGGQQYCSELDIPYASGWLGPAGDVAEGTPGTYTSCPKIVNKPFFRAYNSDISAGSSFPASDGSCTGGELASWNNNTGTNPSSAAYGAGTQLNALAALGITGFASNQKLSPTLNGPPTDLSFANTTNVGPPHIDSPSLGGNFGTTACLTPPPQKAASTPLPNTNVASLTSGSYSYSGDLSLTGGTISTGTDVSIFVTGNVYIGPGATSGISYGGSGTWSVGTVPSFTLVATGNIYIDPNVVELDGSYSAHPASDGSGGTIYTCSDTANHFTYMAKDSLFGCNKQLAVYGTFQANNVDLMRTFGSLRDEAPTPTGFTPVVHHDDPVRLAQYSCDASKDGGDPTNPYKHGHWYETVDSSGNPAPGATDAPGASCHSPHLDRYLGYIFPPGDTTFTSKFLNGNYDLLCEYQGGISGANDHYVLPMAYNSTACNGPGDPFPGHGGTVLGYIWELPSTPGTGPFYENFDGAPACGVNCTGFHYYSNTDNAEGEGPGGSPSIFGYLFTSAVNGRQDYTVNVPVSAAPAVLNPDGSSCSNRPAGFIPRAPQTCAGEVFILSPELYVSNPTIAPPSHGTLQYKAITSLPPVL